MINIVISGYGRLGQALETKVKEDDQLNLVGIVAKAPGEDLKASLEAISEKIDVIIDFSHHSLTETILDFVEANKISLVLATTGQDDSIKSRIEEVSNTTSILYTQNTSLGMTVLMEIASYANQLLGGEADIEIFEKHHNHKLDSPSGTAKMIFNKLNEEDNYEPVYRGDERRQRTKQEIGISAMRAGTIFGEHTVHFGLNDEYIEIKHLAGSIHLFTNGAIKASKFVNNKENGLYAMKDVIIK